MLNPFSELDQRLQRIENLIERINKETPAPSPTTFVDIKTASTITGLPVTTIYKRIREIPRYKHGRSLMFKPDELIRWVESFRLDTDTELSDKAHDQLSKSIK